MGVTYNPKIDWKELCYGERWHALVDTFDDLSLKIRGR